MMYQSCAPEVPRALMQAIVAQESGGNPYAIGVVGGRLVRQPTRLDEAIATATALEEGKRNYSVGVAQINRVNFARTGLTSSSMFEPCANLRAATIILKECSARAESSKYSQPLEATLSCYFSGSLSTPVAGNYVASVMNRLASAPPLSAKAGAQAKAIPVVSRTATSASIPVVVPGSFSDEKGSGKSKHDEKRAPQPNPKPLGDTGFNADKSSLVF